MFLFRFFFYIFCICGASVSFAQGFFIPATETAPRYEKLPPVTYNGPLPTAVEQNVQYIAVDGRFIPLMPETPPQEESFTEPLAIVSDEPAENVALEPSVQNNPPENQPVLLVESAPLDNGIPPYKNRYAQYLQYLAQFQTTKQMPPNPELETTLNKLNSNGYTVFFKQKLH